jgi:hypothetical protein
MTRGRGDGDEHRGVEQDRIRRAVYDSPAVEFATARGDRPRTFPMSPFYDDERGTVVVTSPPAFAGKVAAVRENPGVSLCFYDAADPFVLRGRAEVRDDDLEGNAEYVRTLAESEPASEKRDGFARTASLLESRVGRFLFGWYALRVVVSVRPEAVEPLAGTDGSLPPWPGRDVDAAEAAAYDRLAFTIVDEDGWPVTRTVTDVEVDGEAALLEVPQSVLDGPLGSVGDGRPACLLCHWHSPGLDELGQRLFRGRCRPAGDRVAFRPASSEAMHNETMLDKLRFAIEGKRRTRAYFRE